MKLNLHLMLVDQLCLQLHKQYKILIGLNKAIKHNNYWSEKIFNVIDEIGIATNKTNVNFFLLNFDFVDKNHHLKYLTS